ncbi:hypothetical protein [Nocardia sp. NPDC056100]|uniref:hypothetical protein n=1 Tax=Nocardia sp. NPDC056100 TaxID=3345712 RepID=UPI0035E041A2
MTRYAEGACAPTLTIAHCDLESWLAALVRQSATEAVTAPTVPPDRIPSAGPLRDALVHELGFRCAIGEEAARASGLLVAAAPDTATMEFFATQMIDAVRHTKAFRDCLVEMGISGRDLRDVIEHRGGSTRDRLLAPVDAYITPLLVRGDVLAGALLLILAAEEYLGPLLELSERRWQPLAPAVADRERRAGRDESRYLDAGSTLIRTWLEQQPYDRDRVADIVDHAWSRWSNIPILTVLSERERLFQAALLAEPDLVGDYEIWPGRRLLDTTADERIDVALARSREIQTSRLAYLGLGVTW